MCICAISVALVIIQPLAGKLAVSTTTVTEFLDKTILGTINLAERDCPGNVLPSSCEAQSYSDESVHLQMLEGINPIFVLSTPIFVIFTVLVNMVRRLTTNISP